MSLYLSLKKEETPKPTQYLHACTQERPCDDAVRRQPTASQLERCQQNPNFRLPTFKAKNINVCCLRKRKENEWKRKKGTEFNWSNRKQQENGFNHTTSVIILKLDGQKIPKVN